MAYEWTTGEIITAAKLNATGGGVFFVETSFDFESNITTCNKTAQEIAEAFASGLTVILRPMDSENDLYVFRTIVAFDYDNSSPEDFWFNMYTISGAGTIIPWTADSASSYPQTNSSS